jgi:hypothetical protein
MDERVFKRINVFKGFIRTAKDYTEAVDYHVRKTQTHNRTFHSFGVVEGFRGGLAVRQRRRADMSVEVRPGYAIDPTGCDVLVSEVQVKSLATELFRPPQTVYLVLRYHEEPSDYVKIEIPGFPASAGHARLSERFTLDWTIAEPDPRKELELCRVHLAEDTRAIRDPEDPDAPRSGEIDTRFVRRAAVCVGWQGAVSLETIRQFLLDAIATYTHMARTRGMPSAVAAAASCTILLALAEARMLDQPRLAELLLTLGGLALEIKDEAEQIDPRFATQKKFRVFAERNAKAIEILNKLEELDSGGRLEATVHALIAQNLGLQNLRAVVRPPEHWKISEADLEPGKAIRILDGTSWEAIKEDSNMPRPSLFVDDQEWRLVDSINLLDPDSETAHRFAIREAADWFRSQVRLKYPDQIVVRDEGIGHEGGHAEWEIHNLTPGSPVVIIRRMDYARADYLCRVWVNDLEAGEVPCSGQDTRYRWRNWPFYIHGHYVRHDIIRIKQAIETANRDVNYFQLWFYQPI